MYFGIGSDNGTKRGLREGNAAKERKKAVRRNRDILKSAENIHGSSNCTTVSRLSTYGKNKRKEKKPDIQEERV